MLYYSRNVYCNCKAKGSLYSFQFNNLICSYRSENINSGSVKEHKFVDVAFWILYIVSSVSLGAFEKITPYVPFNFAYSVALSPSVGMYY